ncbi:MAG TPA: lipopolysaccharide biosynthesis protein, partial [Bacteroidia bacterium]
MQENTNINTSYTVNESNSLKDLILNIRDWIHYFLSKKYIIILFGLLGGGLGFTYALLKKPVYIASTSFVLETGGNKGALASYAGIASAFGIDLGGGGGGLFEGENILELYKSRNMITKALLSEGVFGNKKQLLIDRYIEFNNLRKSWDKNPRLKNIQFRPDNLYQSDAEQLLHDSIIGRIVKNIETRNLKVEKKDKKLNVIYVTVSSPDELFAKAFNERLVQNVNQFYLETKSRKNLENVQILQAKVDSVRSVLSGSIVRAASTADATPNQNPTRLAQRIVPMQNSRVNAEISQGVLSSLLQNLELSKITLSKETPLIQIVDRPILPLESKKIGKILA